MNHTSLLNYLADKIKAKTYLEIGVQTTQQNFDKIKVPIKVGVDPAVDDPKVLKMTSDDFFTYIEGVQSKNGVTKTFDLIFLDGLHHADQIERDFNNALARLNDGGYIVIHDTLPEVEQTTCVPRGNQKMWHGDVWKFCMNIDRPGIDYMTLNADNGCMIVWKDKDMVGGEDAPLGFELTWDNYLKYRDACMNIVEPEDFKMN